MENYNISSSVYLWSVWNFVIKAVYVFSHDKIKILYKPVKCGTHDILQLMIVITPHNTYTCKSAK